MKKSLIALAVASAFAAPAFASTGNVDIYGKVRVSLDYVDVTGLENSWQLNDQTSRIGFKGAEDLGGGLKAVWQMETALSSTGGEFSNIGGGTLSSRNTFIGLAGDFGTFLMGKHDTPYKLAGSADLFADTSADSQNGSAIIGFDLDGNGLGGFDIRATNAIAYVSPSFSGLTIVAATVPGEQVFPGSKANGLFDAYSLAALYGNGPLSLSLGYETHSKNLVSDLTAPVNVNESETAWKLNVGYTIGDFKLGATYEDQDGVVGMKSKNYLVSAAYGMGPVTLAAQYGKRNVNATAEGISVPALGMTGRSDLTRWTVGAVYGLSKRTSTYLAYDHDKYDNGASDGVKANIWTVGLNHDF